MSEKPGTVVDQPPRVSFTVRRPSPVSSRQSSAGPESNVTTPTGSFRIPQPPRQQSSYSAPPSRLRHEETERDEVDSSDEEDPEAAELVSGFDSMGVQRVKPAAKTNGPLVIPVLKNRDWRQLARQRQAATGYVPDSARAAAITGPDGSQGGLGTRDSINSGPQLTGLIVKKHVPAAEPTSQEPTEPEPRVDEDTEMAPAKPLTEDELALQALLRGTDESTSQPQVAAIPLAPMTEEAALQRDMADLPDTASLDDYARVPVEQFGMAMLRGMGWKPPTNGEDELWIPAERPALLGLGAKARPAGQGGSGPKSQAMNWKTSERKYVPLVKKDRNGDIVQESKESNSRSGSKQGSRRNSRSRSPHSRYDSSRRDRDRDDSHDRDRDRRDRDREYRDSDREGRDRDREYKRDREGERARDRHDRDGRGERDRDDDRRRRDEEGSGRKDRERDSGRDYDRYGSSKRRDDRDYDSRKR